MGTGFNRWIRTSDFGGVNPTLPTQQFWWANPPQADTLPVCPIHLTITITAKNCALGAIHRRWMGTSDSYSLAHPSACASLRQMPPEMWLNTYLPRHCRLVPAAVYARKQVFGCGPTYQGNRKGCPYGFRWGKPHPTEWVRRVCRGFCGFLLLRLLCRLCPFLFRGGGFD